MDLNVSNAADDLIRAAKRAYSVGLQTGNGGNISVRIPDKEQMWVKPSGLSFADIDRDNLVLTDFEGNVIQGGTPTQESFLHGMLYRKCQSIGGVVHTHSPWSILCSLCFDSIALITKHAAMKLVNPVPVLDVLAPAVTPAEIHKVEALFATNLHLAAFVLKSHGIVAVAKDAYRAELVAELVEETAHIVWHSRAIPQKGTS